MKTCNATDCIAQISSDHLFCRHHWILVPSFFKELILETHRSRPSARWAASVINAIMAIQVMERKIADVRTMRV